MEVRVEVEDVDWVWLPLGLGPVARRNKCRWQMNTQSRSRTRTGTRRRVGTGDDGTGPRCDKCSVEGFQKGHRGAVARLFGESKAGRIHGRAAWGRGWDGCVVDGVWWVEEEGEPDWR